MHNIKLHLESEEFEPVNALARALGVHPEDIAYAGLNRIMSNLQDAALREEIVNQRNMRKNALPRWAEHAQEIHAYEGM